MRHNNVYNINDTITLVVPATLENKDIYAYKYVYGSVKVPITFKTNVMGNYKYIYIDPTGNDCYVIVKIGDETEFIRVGKPPVAVLFRWDNFIPEVEKRTVCDYLDYDITSGIEPECIEVETEIPMTYKQYNYNSVLISEGTPIDLLHGIYAIPVNSIVRSYFDIMGNLVTLTDPSKYASINVDSLRGTIKLQRGKWQLITLPIPGKVRDIFLLKLESQTGVPYSELIEVVSTYPGHLNRFLSYIPGHTQPEDDENFDLIMNDNGSKEITAFWVHCKNWTHTEEDIIFTWDNTI